MNFLVDFNTYEAWLALGGCLYGKETSWKSEGLG